MEEEIDVKEMIKYFGNKKRLYIIMGIIGVLLAIIFTKFIIKPQYVAMSSFILTNYDLETEADVYKNSQLPDRYYAIADSITVWNKVVKNLKLDEELKFKNIDESLKFKEENIEITQLPANFMIEVSVISSDAKRAANIANEIVRVAIEEIKNTNKDEKIQILDVALENWKPVNASLIENVIKFFLIFEILALVYVFVCYIFIDELKKEKINQLEERKRISEEYKLKEKNFIFSINKDKKIIDIVKLRKELEKNIKSEEYKKVSKINDEILKYYVEEAYIAGYMDAKK